MRNFSSLISASLVASLAIVCAVAPAVAGAEHHHGRHQAQETGFLNRQIVVRGVTHRYQVYVPEQWNPSDHKLWPILLYLHGRGERGAEGMWQTQIGLPEAVRDHPERWPFLIVMPQCPQNAFWTDPDSLALAMETLDEETAEFHGDPQRTYLAGISMGGYGAWELIRQNPHRWAAAALAASGIFWSYAPERWQRASTLPAEYARSLGHTAVWLFHGTDDPVVQPKQDELLFDAIKAEGGRVRLWLYQGLHHDCWTRAFKEPDLARWLLSHHLEPGKPVKEPPAYAERTLVPPHPPAVRLSQAQLEALAGEYSEPHSHGVITILRQGDQLFERDIYGQMVALDAESLNILFFPGGAAFTRIYAERDAQGRVIALVYHDDRHEERWERKSSPPTGSSSGPRSSFFSF
jgi:poly(3-hydroxybutyrate) depolymerase